MVLLGCTSNINEYFSNCEELGNEGGATLNLLNAFSENILPLAPKETDTPFSSIVLLCPIDFYQP